MTPPHKIENEILFVNKPSGVTTHASSPEQPGFLEKLEQLLGIPKLYPIHRLDRETTGALACALSPKAAQQSLQHFQDFEVKKSYLFLTRSQSQSPTFEIENHLIFEKKRALATEGPVNARTRFIRRKRNAFFELWEAQPKSGKTHQIRAHASLAGLPILGDSVYGGAPFPHLCLHSESLELPGRSIWKVAPPIFFERMGLLRDAKLCRWLSAIDRRERLFGFLSSPQECVRLIHRECSDLILDQLGNQLWGQWNAETSLHLELNSAELRRLEFLSQLLGKPLILKQRLQRGSGTQEYESWEFGENLSIWSAHENQNTFEFRKSQGLSPGLFLDQRLNRQRVFESSKDLRLVNLFSYTCGFSVCAAKGGAREVTSVDLSQASLDWGRRNFALNQIEGSAKFVKMDAREFLRMSEKKNHLYDAWIVDPPSFGRGPQGVFRIERDLPEILRSILKLWTRRGWILIGTNSESWPEEKIRVTLESLFSDCKIESLRGDWDFELPGQPAVLKSFWIRCK